MFENSQTPIYLIMHALRLDEFKDKLHEQEEVGMWLEMSIKDYVIYCSCNEEWPLMST